MSLQQTIALQPKPADWDQTIQFQLFNPSLGTLDYTVLSLTEFGTAQLTVTSPQNATTGLSGNWQQESTLSLSFGGTYFEVSSGFVNNFTVPATQSATYTENTSASGSEVFNGAASDIFANINVGTQTQNSFVFSSPNWTANDHTYLGADIDLTYVLYSRRYP